MRLLTDAKPHRRRRVAALAVALALVGSLILASGALANFITPKSGGSPNADQIASLYKIILYIAAVVFVIVEGALVYSVYKFRAKKSAVAAQIHGNTRLEIGWTVAAALILVRADRRHVREAAGHHQPAELERRTASCPRR